MDRADHVAREATDMRWTGGKSSLLQCPQVFPHAINVHVEIKRV